MSSKEAGAGILLQELEYECRGTGGVAGQAEVHVKTICCFLPFAEKDCFALCGSCAQSVPSLLHTPPHLGWGLPWAQGCRLPPDLIILKLAHVGSILECSRLASRERTLSHHWDTVSVDSSLAEGGCVVDPGG